MITCKEYVTKIRENIKNEVDSLKTKPVLSIVQVGDDPASTSYIKGKLNACSNVGIVAKHYHLDASINQESLKEVVREAVECSDGCIVQLPLPKHLDESKITCCIPSNKDVDGFRADSKFTSCTPLGILNYIKYNNIDIEGKNCVVIGRSNIVGKPMAKLMMDNNATVTVCHSKTKNIKDFTSIADIIIVAVGKRHTLTSDMVKEGAVVIDVGVNRNEENKLCGDCDYESLKDKCNLITPVPGGIGPITITTLLENTLRAYKLNH